MAFLRVVLRPRADPCLPDAGIVASVNPDKSSKGALIMPTSLRTAVAAAAIAGAGLAGFGVTSAFAQTDSG